MNHRIKILFLINNLSLGGAELMLLDLIKNLDHKKYEIAVGTVMGGGELEEKYREAGIPLYLYVKKGKLGFDVIKNFRKIIREFQPHIVHTHLLSADTWGRIAAILEQSKIIVTTEHNVALEENGFIKSIKHFLSYYSDRVIAPSLGIKKYSVRKELIDAGRIEVIYHGIDLAKFPFRGVRVARYGDGQVELLNIGRLVPQKGQRILIEALAKLDDVYPDARLKIAGQGPLKDSLIEVADRLHVGEKVDFVGPVFPPNPLLEKSDIFVFSSIYEGLGLAALEALAVGIPVIASDIPGVNEFVIDEETGLLFESENSDELVEKIIHLLKNPELQEHMILHGRAMVEERFTVERMAGEYDELYGKLLKEKRIELEEEKNEHQR